MKKWFSIIIILLFQYKILLGVPTLISFTGQLRDPSENPYTNASFRISIKTNISSSPVWGPYTYDDVLDSYGSFNIILGKTHSLNLEPGKEYYMIVEVDKNSSSFISADVTFGDDNPSGDIIIINSGANDNFVLNSGDIMNGNYTIISNLIINGDLSVKGNTYITGNLMVSNNSKFYTNIILTNGWFIFKGTNGKRLEIREGAGIDFETTNAVLYINHNYEQAVQMGSYYHPLPHLKLYGDFVVEHTNGKRLILRRGSGMDIETTNAILYINPNFEQAIQAGSPAHPVPYIKLYGKIEVYGDPYVMGSRCIYFDSTNRRIGIDEGVLSIRQNTSDWMKFRNGAAFVWMSNAGDNVKMRLEVSDGSLYIDGTYHSGGADLSEFFYNSTNINFEPGDVLVIDENGKIQKCDKLNQNSVIGVVTEKPGILLGTQEETVSFLSIKGTKIPVALLGQVKVKVCDFNGPVLPGDLLTTSPIPGYAAKAIPVEINGHKIYRPGTIIGKALEKLKGKKGKINALINLQ